MATALIIIDMQAGMSRPEAGERNNPQAEMQLAALLQGWRKAQAPVVHVRHLSATPGSGFFPGQPLADFQPAFMPLPDELVISKRTPDAFVGTSLQAWLALEEIVQLVITGVSTSNSVEATTRSAGNLGFSAHVVHDATFTFAKADFDGIARSAQQVHAMSLANLNGEYATIISAQQALALLAKPLSEK